LKILRLELDGFRSYDALDLDLSKLDKAAIIGRNGAGKSSILKAIAWAPFGEGSADELMARERESMRVALTFSLDGHTYKVTRTRERNKKSLLALEQATDEEPFWRSLSEAKIVDTQAKIHRLLGSAEVFTSSVYSPQNQVGAFLSLRAGERKALLGELLDLGRYEGWREEASAAARACGERAGAAMTTHSSLKSRHDVLASRMLADPLGVQRDIEACSEAIDGLGVALDRAIERQKDVERVQRRQSIQREIDGVLARGRLARDRNIQRKTLAEQIAAAADLEDELSVAEGKLRVQEAEVAAIKATARAARQANMERARRLSELESLFTQWEKTCEELGTEADRHVAMAKAMRGADDGQTCPTCGQMVDAEHREQVAKTHDEAAAAIAPKISEALVKAGEYFSEHETLAAVPEQDATDVMGVNPDLLSAVDKARSAVGALRRLEGQLEGLGAAEDTKEMKAQWDALTAEAATLPETVAAGDSPAEVQARIAENQQTSRLLQDRLREHERDKGEADELLTQLTAAAEQSASETDRQRALEVCARAFGRDGIPAMILDGMVGSIEASANRALEEFGSQMRLQLTTQREKKSGGLSETLDVVVDDGANEASVDTFSGGERYRIAIALRLGIAEALGHSSECLLIDEPTDLDTQGMRDLGEILAATSRQCLVVSHVENFLADFPQRLKVTREGLGPSQVTMS
jgi:DNA repair exonuclease SbcCD ATPase subunit